MIIHISKTFLLTIAAIALVTLGAVGTWAGTKLMASTTDVPAAPAAKTIANPTPPVAPIAKDTTSQVIAAPVTKTAVQEVKVPEAANVPVPAAAVSNVAAPTIEKESSVKPGYVLADIIDVRPHYVQIRVPYRDCHMEPRTILVSGHPTGAGVAVGGVAGGLLGHELGGGRGKVATTIGGTILGAVVGSQVENSMVQPQPRTVYVRVCRTEYMSKAVRKGYEVTYMYHHQKDTIITKHAPIQETILIPASRV